MSVNFIPCLTWVARGKAKAVPDKIQLTEDDLKRVIDETKNKMGNSAEGHPEGMETNDEDDIVQRYNLDDYDDDDDDNEEEMEGGNDSNVNIAMNDMSSLANLTVFASNSNDPYLSRQTGDSDSEEEKDNFEIKELDNLLVIGHVEGNSSVLEVHVYNSEQEDFYPHHDIVLGSYPLCFQWLSRPDKTNCIACGDMSPDISIWDLDVVNLLEPVVKLSGHKDSVLSLAWDESNHLVSGSADKNVFLWDLNEGKMSKVKRCKGNVQGVSFQPESKAIVLSGDDKGNAFVSDIRSTDSFKSWTFPGCEVEGLLFDQLRGNNFFIATDQGTVFYCDSRMESKPIYSLDAHSEAVTGISQSVIRKDCLVTASADKTLKVWNISSGEKASFVTEHSRVKVGRIMTMNFSPDDPFIVAVGGDSVSNNYKILDLSTLKAVKESFGLKK